MGGHNGPGQLGLSFVAGAAFGGIGTLFLNSRKALRLGGKKRSLVAETDDAFSIDPALSHGNVEIGKLPLCQVLLYDDQRFEGWLMLVPRKNNLKEVIDLSEENQELLWKEVAMAQRVIQKAFQIDKLNVSAIGNLLHIHVTGRRRRDAAWPDVHLGRRGRESYPADRLQKTRQALIEGFREDGRFELLVEEDDC